MWPSVEDTVTYLADGDPRHKNKRKTKKFRCERDPVHSKCKKGRCSFARRDHKDRILWEVEWAPCLEEKAIEYMRDIHNYEYVPSRREDRGKSHSKSQDKARSNKHSIPSAPGPCQQRTAPSATAPPASASHHNTPAQAAGRHCNQHHQMRPPTAVPMDTFSPQEDFRQQENNQMVQAWIPDPQMARPPDQNTVRAESVVSHRHMTSRQGMGPPPGIPMPRDAPGGQHQYQDRHRHHHKGHHKSSRAPTAVPPDASEPAEMAASDTGMDLPLGPPQPGNMAPAGLSNMSGQTMPMPPIHNMSLNPAAESGLRMAGHYGTQFPQGRYPGSMGSMAENRGVPPPPGPSHAHSARGSLIPPGMQSSSSMAMDHMRQAIPTSMPPFPGTRAMPPSWVPSPPPTLSDNDSPYSSGLRGCGCRRQEHATETCRGILVDEEISWIGSCL